YLGSYAYPYNSHHEIIINGLEQNTIYNYKIFVTDPAGNTQESQNLFFTTSSLTITGNSINQEYTKEKPSKNIFLKIWEIVKKTF
ncbi:MAG: hypothetical protein Q8N88_04945, partial [Nanoarchaeota archaeon]|nr:hypothetical protein [Nanoarchaeota archaeon]